jgi:putative transposase
MFARRCRWDVMAAVVMPDHAHMIVAPVEDRDLSIGDFAAGFKRLLRKTLGSQDWQWQRGCFDRLLRSEGDLGSKWMYVQENPVRAGLVRQAEDWPFYFDLNDDGKLAASPTDS